MRHSRRRRMLCRSMIAMIVAASFTIPASLPAVAQSRPDTIQGNAAAYAAWLAQHPDAPVVIRASGTASTSQLVSALARATGAPRFSIASESMAQRPADTSPAPSIPVDRCATIATEFKTQCATANDWFQKIGSRYGSEIQRHYLWLQGNAAAIDDYTRNGCDPSPCDSMSTGRLQAQDYFAQDGFDSPLGVVHDKTPVYPMELRCLKVDPSLGCTTAGIPNAPGPWWSVTGTLGGELGSDGKIHGAVLYNGEYYEGTIADTACASGCYAEFDHPGTLPDHSYGRPIYAYGLDHRLFATWWTFQPCSNQCRSARP